MPPTSIFLFAIIAALIPTLIYIGIVYWADRYEKEPFWLLSAAFLWGAIPSIVVAFIFNTALSIPIYVILGDGLAAEAASAAIIAPLVEESIKGALLLGIFLFWRHEIDSPLDGIIYGAMVGLGFGMVENVYYFINQYNAGGLEAMTVNIFFRAVIFGLNHALFSGFTGLGIAIARLSPNTAVKFIAPILGWGTAVFLHFLHNLTVSIGDAFVCAAIFLDWGGVWVLIAIIVWAIWQERSWLRKYLGEEVALGTLTQQQCNLTCSGIQRFTHSASILFNKGWRANREISHFFHECSHLAYKKHHYELFAEERDANEIGRLRIKISEISKNL